MVIFTKENMYIYKPIPVVNIPHVRFIGGPKRQGRTGGIQGGWEPEISVAMINTVGVPVEEVLADIGTKSRKLVVFLECDGNTYWLSSLGEVCPTQSVDQWVD